MKKLFLTLALVILAGTTWASVWDAKTTYDLPNETPVIVQVNINGRPANGNDGIELAAFIGDECRADATYMIYSQTQQELFQLRVVGDLSTERGKTVTFKADYHGMQFSFTKTILFTGEVYTPAPLVLNIDMPTGVKASPVTITQPASAFPYSESLTNYAELDYASKDGSTYQPLGESTMLTPLYIHWRMDFPSNVVTISGNNTINVSMPISETGNIVAEAWTTAEPNPTVSPLFSGSTTYTVSIATTPVESITADIDSYTCNAFESILNDIESHITVLPANADNKSFYITVMDSRNEPTNYFNGKFFTNGGEYVIVVTPNDEGYTGEPLRIPVTVNVQPNGLTCDLNTYNGSEYYGEVHVGDNVAAYVAEHTTITYPTDGTAINPVGEIEIVLDDEDCINRELIATNVGYTWVTVRLKDMPNGPSYRLSIDIPSQLVFRYVLNNREFLTGEEKNLCYIYVDNPDNETFDKENIELYIGAYKGDSPCAVLSKVTAQTNTTDVDGQSHDACYAVDILPKYAYEDNIYFALSYEGRSIGTGEETISQENKNIRIAYGQKLESGWNWMSINYLPTMTATPTVESIFGEASEQNIVEVRSQHALIYNDPDMGYFGDLQYITPNDGCYKVKSAKAMTLNMGHNCLMESQDMSGDELHKGYNWINVPYYFDVNLSMLEEALYDFMPAEGDQIITRTQFAEYDGEKWVASNNFKLKAGEGMVYYNNSDTEPYFAFGWLSAPLEDEAPVKAEFGQNNVKAADIFKYNAHAYADNMAMVARIEGIENAEDYIVGVFVGDECRGNGEVAQGNILFINATGRTGEKLTLKLHNKLTGETVDIEGTQTYNLHNGSISNPVVLKAPGMVTAISSVKNSQSNTTATYDLSGRRVENAQKGIYIKGGKKVIK